MAVSNPFSTARDAKVTQTLTKDIHATGQTAGDSRTKRVTFIKKDTTAAVRQQDEDLVMTFPHLVVRGIIVFQVLVILLTVISLLYDAPLKSIADPQHTEVPAKAPWYFLGLQELLHYFPPVVGGVLIPLLVVLALVVIPYFEINIKPDGLWERDRMVTFVRLTVATSIITITMAFFHAWAIALPTVVVYGFMLLPLASNSHRGFMGWLRKNTLWHWVMTWFVLLVTVLTCIGVFFRGPYWRWTWPWIEGIY